MANDQCLTTALPLTVCCQTWRRRYLPELILSNSVIGSLAFGAPFGMIGRQADIVLVEDESGKITHLPAVQILNERGEYSATQGALPTWIRPYTKVRISFPYSGDKHK